MRRPVPWGIVEAETRRGLYANQLPGNQALPNDVTDESLQRGWTVQQPFTHVTASVPIGCVVCGTGLDARNWVAHRCPVLAYFSGAADG